MLGTAVAVLDLTSICCVCNEGLVTMDKILDVSQYVQ